MHSVLFFVIGICTFYVLMTAALDRINPVTWYAFGVVILELGILIWNDWQCPLTHFAEDRGALSGSVADLFLPIWLADHLFKIFGFLFGLSCLLLVWRSLW